ncbi:AAA family ATPase [Candidatus Bathyarchaeota archaeon]|nr:AAA family ATPase [Candidatus Bathyarchaeota archaeon]
MLERVPTGIAGLDEMLEGGIPRGRTVIIVGGPGTGKTIMCTQFLVNGIMMYGENGIFVSLEESRSHLYQAMERFSWDLDRLEKAGNFRFVDASPLCRAAGDVKIGKYAVGRREFSILGLMNTIEQIAELTDAKRIAVDPLAMIIFQYKDMHERRNAYVDMIDSLTATGATCMTTMEVPSTGPGTVVEEEYLAHGVIALQNLQIGKAMTRVMQIRKMRATAADFQPRPYKIDNSGIVVYADETIF